MGSIFDTIFLIDESEGAYPIINYLHHMSVCASVDIPKHNELKIWAQLQGNDDKNTAMLVINSELI